MLTTENLGHVVRSSCLKLASRTKNAIIELKYPRHVISARSLLKLCNVSRFFVEIFNSNASSLAVELQNNQLFTFVLN